MNPTRTNKTFDCIEFKRRVQAEIYEGIRGLPQQEQIEFFRRRAEEGPLGEWWKSIKRAKKAEPGE